MAIQYLTETKSFRHQRYNSRVTTTSGTHPDGTPVIVPAEQQPDPMQQMQDYLDDKGFNDWDLVSSERLESASDKYSFLFIFKK